MTLAWLGNSPIPDPGGQPRLLPTLAPRDLPCPYQPAACHSTVVISTQAWGQVQETWDDWSPFTLWMRGPDWLAHVKGPDDLSSLLFTG